MNRVNKSNRLVQGIGVKGADYATWDGKTHLREYQLWSCMLFRCTKKCWAKFQTYIGTSCSENFKHYSFFHHWCQEQAGFTLKDENSRSWQLDKDLLVKGNKVYSEDTCVFVPPSINCLLTRSKATRGKHMIGVCFNKSSEKFTACCRDGGNKLKHLGCFNTEQEAFQAYKTFKETLIQEIANDYKTQLDPRAYQALMNYQVEVTD